jgi:hypothetical protein
MPDQNDSCNTLHQPKTAFRSAHEMGRQAYLDSTSGMPDPAGEEHERERLRALGRWRFILLRGALGVGLPMLVWLVLTHLKEPIQDAHRFHRSTLYFLLQSWAVGISISVFFGLILGLLAWRRVTSDYWPNTKADPESTLTRMDPL